MPEVKSQRRDEKVQNEKLNHNHRSPTFRMLYYWGKFLGVNPLSLSKNNEFKFSYIALFYGCFLGSLYCYVASRAFSERREIRLPTETPIAIIVDFMRLGCQCIDGSLTWFIFAIHQDRIKLIVQSFVKAEKISRRLGIPDNYEKFFNEFGHHLTLNNLLCLGSILLAEIMWNRIVNFDRKAYTVFNLLSIASFNAIILFIWSLVLVERKFNRLNAKVQLLMENKNLIAHQTDKEMMILSSSRNPNQLTNIIYMVSQLHHELRRTIHCIERHFAPVILFNIANNFTYMTLTTYRLYRYVWDQNPPGGIFLEYLAAVNHQVLYPIAILIVISNICGSTAEKANNTRNMLHAMINNYNNIHGTRINAPSRDFQELNVVSLGLLHNPISMSLFGLLKLNNFTVYSIVASVTNYLIIMLQLQD